MTRRPPTWVYVFTATLAFNLLAASYTAADADGWKESALAAQTVSEVRPYHLLQTPLNRAAIGLGQALSGSTGRPFVPVQILNTLCAAIAAAMLYRLLRRLGCERGVAAGAVAVFVLSATPLLHSRTGETGMTPMPLVLGAFLLLWPKRPVDRWDAVVRGVAAAVLIGLGSLLSLNVAVVAPAVLVGAARLGRRSGAGTALPLVAATAAGSLVLFGPLAVAAAQQHLGSHRAVLHWLTYHSDTKGLAASGGVVINALRALVGLGRLVFTESAGETALKAVLRHHRVDVTWVDWLTLARNLVATAVLLGLVIAGWRRLSDEARPVLAPALGLVALGNLVWLGSDPQYWLTVYPFLLLLAALAVQARVGTEAAARRRLAWGFGALLTLLLLANVPGTTPSPLWPRWSDEWERARTAAIFAETNATLVVPGGSPLRLTRQLRSDLRTLDLTYDADERLEGQAFLDWLGAQLDAALTRGPVYLEGLREPLQPATLGEWEMIAGTHKIRREAIEAWLDQHYRLEPWSNLGHVETIRRR